MSSSVQLVTFSPVGVFFYMRDMTVYRQDTNVGIAGI